MKTLKSLRRVVIVALFVAVRGVCQAQHCDSIINQQAGYYNLLPDYMIQLGDGSILIRSYLNLLEPSGQLPITAYASQFFKISRHGAEVMDTLFVLDDNVKPKLLAHLHPGDGVTQERSNVLVEYILDLANVRTDLRIAFFDDDLHFDGDEIIVPLADTLVQCNYNLHGSFLLDTHNDIITEYGIPTRRESHFARFGLDGSLKHERVYHDSIVPVQYLSSSWVPSALRQTGESPLRYSFYGCPYHLDFKGFELDSLFNITNVLYLPSPNLSQFPRMFIPTGHSGMVSLGEEGYVIMEEYAEHLGQMTRIGVAKYDKELNLLKTWFSSITGQASGSGNYYAGVDLRMGQDGNICFVAKTLYQACGYEACYIVKMDKDLNIIYERYYTNPIWDLEIRGMNVLDGGGMCVYGDSFKRLSDPWLSGLFVLVLDDDGVAVSETEGVLRPYCFFPNPVHDRLNVHYSPDVTPVLVETYDLEGRLLRSQNHDIETINMDGLPAGAYTLRVLMKDGTVFSDKVVKD